jgi:predicted ribosomally synthesized peptide with nif11-like leader
MDEAEFQSLAEQELLPIAKQSGYEFTMADLKSFGEEMQQADLNCELSDSEMETVAGGCIVFWLVVVMEVFAYSLVWVHMELVVLGKLSTEIPENI